MLFIFSYRRDVLFSMSKTKIQVPIIIKPSLDPITSSLKCHSKKPRQKKKKRKVRDLRPACGCAWAVNWGIPLPILRRGNSFPRCRRSSRRRSLGYFQLCSLPHARHYVVLDHTLSLLTLVLTSISTCSRTELLLLPRAPINV